MQYPPSHSSSSGFKLCPKKRYANHVAVAIPSLPRCLDSLHYVSLGWIRCPACHFLLAHRLRARMVHWYVSAWSYSESRSGSTNLQWEDEQVKRGELWRTLGNMTRHAQDELKLTSHSPISRLHSRNLPSEPLPRLLDSQIRPLPHPG
jgi:hypothetical protein